MMISAIKYLLTSWLLLSMTIDVVQAQSEEPLSTDRPGEGTDAASVVGASTFQLEMGIFREWDQQGNYSSLQYPTALLRYGVLDKMEIRIASGLFTSQTKRGAGWSPVDVSAKVTLIDQPQGWLPQAALLVGLTLPKTGSSSEQSRFTQPRIVLLLNHTLASWLGITTNLGAHWEDDSPETIYRYALSFDVSVSDRVGAFAEFYGDLPEASRNAHLFNAGLIYLINYNLQLDMAAGTALTERAPDFYVGGGLSVRW